VSGHLRYRNRIIKENTKVVSFFFDSACIEYIVKSTGVGNRLQVMRSSHVDCGICMCGWCWVSERSAERKMKGVQPSRERDDMTSRDMTKHQIQISDVM
jgi:hypothetical protein